MKILMKENYGNLEKLKKLGDRRDNIKKLYTKYCNALLKIKLKKYLQFTKMYVTIIK